MTFAGDESGNGAVKNFDTINANAERKKLDKNAVTQAQQKFAAPMLKANETPSISGISSQPTGAARHKSVAKNDLHHNDAAPPNADILYTRNEQEELDATIDAHKHREHVSLIAYSGVARRLARETCMQRTVTHS